MRPLEDLTDAEFEAEIVELRRKVATTPKRTPEEIEVDVASYWAVIIEEAQTTYRAAWQSYLFAKTERERDMWARTMDDAQMHCVKSGRPGPEWDAFRATLPGFNEFWDGCKASFDLKVKAMREKLPKGN